MADVSLTYGGCYISSSATTTLAAATPAKAAGTTTSMGLNGFSHSSNKLTYTGTATRVFSVHCAVSASTISGAETVNFYIHKNDSLVTGSQIQRKVSNNDVGAAACNALVSLATNDYVELWVSSLGGDDVVIEFGTMIAKVAG